MILSDQVALHWAEVVAVAGKLDRERQFNVPGGRSVRRVAKVTPDQDLVLRARAEQAGMSVPRLLVESALADHAPETAKDRRELLAELFRLERSLSAVGNNLNQLTRAANATGQIEGNLLATLASIRKTVRDLDRAVESLALEDFER